MLFAQIVSTALPDAVSQTPGFSGKISILALYLATASAMGFAVGNALTLLAGAARIIFKSFQFRWAFPAAIIVAFLALYIWVSIATRCFRIVGNVGDHSDYWNQTAFVIFLVFPGLVAALFGGMMAWAKISLIVEELRSFSAICSTIGVFSLYGLALYSICFSYSYLVTQWSLEVCALTLFIPPVWASMTIWGPIYVCLQTGNWLNFWTILVEFLICLCFFIPRFFSNRSESSE